ncbi:polysaccharide deacetylase family protein [Lysinibacillus yapensis]|uniref:Polysaccharide deacetylase family protein n=1 Tax=Ureibacillus yapensis TaxID=2304605 RepID=A0A396S5R2_9BACL|nr:polysaccharide deacetylase family protein [Lysinibacillus yapensis]RHW35837.1 polysaccharide deacetylase family protein [Lysinibacillus yapensis]
MRKAILSLLGLFLIGVAIFFVTDSKNGSVSADRGRKFYEEAGQIIWDIKTERKVVALTFDDGPHKKYTSEILDLLDQYDAKGTFFIVGQQAEKNPDVVMRMYEDGHELANHTYTHPYSRNVSKIMKEIKQTNDAIFSITGQTPTLFRPVEGQYTDPMIDEISKGGYKVVMWSWHQDTEDWRNPGVNRIVNRVLNGIREGDVVLFHDGGGNRTQTVRALEKILPELQNQGYQFVTITDLMKIQMQESGQNGHDYKVNEIDEVEQP